jgi:hypothetical protein
VRALRGRSPKVSNPESTAFLSRVRRWHLLADSRRRCCAGLHARCFITVGVSAHVARPRLSPGLLACHTVKAPVSPVSNAIAAPGSRDPREVLRYVDAIISRSGTRCEREPARVLGDAIKLRDTAAARSRATENFISSGRLGNICQWQHALGLKDALR